MQRMTAQEIYDLAPYGATVHFSDGTKRPPDRFNKKLAAWKRNNSNGFFVKKDAPHKQIEGSVGGISLQLMDTDVMSYVYGISMNSKLTFDVELPSPGTVLAYHEFEGRIEVNHVHKDINAYLEWCRRNRYTPFGHGGSFWVINNKGERETLTETPVVESFAERTRRQLALANEGS